MSQSLLQVFHFTAVFANSDSHHGERVVCRDAMIVYTAIECHCSVFAYLALEQSQTTWMYINKIADIMNETSDQDEFTIDIFDG
jgi:hypothetical protein